MKHPKTCMNIPACLFFYFERRDTPKIASHDKTCTRHMTMTCTFHHCMHLESLFLYIQDIQDIRKETLFLKHTPRILFGKVDALMTYFFFFSISRSIDDTQRIAGDPPQSCQARAALLVLSFLFSFSPGLAP